MCWYRPIPDLFRNAPVLESMAYNSITIQNVEKSIEKRSFRRSHHGQRDGTVFQALISCVSIVHVKSDESSA